MKAKLHVEFYAVELSKGTGSSFEALLGNIGRVSDLSQRNEHLQGIPFRLQILDQDGEFVSGDMVRIRMDNLPRKASLRGDLADFDLKDDEGVGEETAFLYHIPTAILLLQKTKTGVSSARFAEYVELRNNLDDPIFLCPVLKKNAQARFEKLSLITKIHMRAARITNPNLFANTDPSTASLIKGLTEGIAPTIELTISVGKVKTQQRGLNRTGVMNRVLALMKARSNEAAEVTKLEICGKTPDEQTNIVDFIKDHMKESPEVDTGTARRIAYTTRLLALRAAWKARRKEILDIRRPNDDGEGH